MQGIILEYKRFGNLSCKNNIAMLVLGMNYKSMHMKMLFVQWWSYWRVEILYEIIHPIKQVNYIFKVSTYC